MVAVLAVVLANIVWEGVVYALERQPKENPVERRRVKRRVLWCANGQVAVDLFLLTGIIRYTGGIESPLAIFYMFHMAIGSFLLLPWQAILQGVWAVVLFAGLSSAELWGLFQPHYSFLHHVNSTDLHNEPAFVGSAQLVFACSVFGILYFMLHVAGLLADRERELRDTNTALRKSQRAIKDLQERRARFMQTAAHQLKSPLAAIETLAGLVRDAVVPPEAVRPTCEKITMRCQEGIRQVSELLALARVEGADPVRHTLYAAETVSIVTELCQRYRLLAEKKGVTLNFVAPTEPNLRVAVDTRDLTDCLDNLISNAVKYTPSAGEVSVSVSCGKCAADAFKAAEQGFEGTCNGRPEFVAIVVKDTGIGIEPDALPDSANPHPAGSIFEDFRRGKTALEGGLPGTGLGLSIVRAVVEQVGGKIRVASKVGEGSTFSVAFPAWRGDGRGSPSSPVSSVAGSASATPPGTARG